MGVIRAVTVGERQSISSATISRLSTSGLSSAIRYVFSVFDPGQVISHAEMSLEEGAMLQRGMNFRLNPTHSVILMSTREGAPYGDQLQEEGRVLVYEGHDLPDRKEGPDPKQFDQPERHKSGKLTQNGKFHEAAQRYQEGKREPEPVRVYEKIRSGIWVYNGLFHLVESWRESDGQREVFKFRLEMVDEDDSPEAGVDIDHNRVIPARVKREVWERDDGQCVKCGSSENLHFDHVIPFSKGGSSLVPENIQLLCARHNLEKRDKIE